MRTKFIAGNWKMYKTVGEAVQLAQELRVQLKDCPHKLLVAPPFTALSAVSAALKGGPIRLGAQNMACAEQGAHTGEVSVLMLRDLGVSTVILGHSERRSLYKEGDELINVKVKLALSHGLEVILCVGETLAERDAGRAEAVVGDQTRRGLNGVALDDLSRLTIAYEPVWAIGTGRNATPGDADAIHGFIRSVVGSLYSVKAAAELTIQYGGSVKPDNAKELLSMPNIDGALVGGASLKADQFVPIAASV